MSASLITFANLGRKTNLRTTDMLPMIKALDEAGELKQVICQINAGFYFPNTSSAIPAFIRYPIRVIEKLIGKTLPRRLTEKLFDLCASIRLQRADVTFFHGGFVFPRTVARARKLGSIVVDISTSSHFATNAKLEKEEFELMGFPGYEGWYTKLVREATPLSSMDYMILMSDYTRETYVAAGYPRDHIFIAYVDVDTERFSPPKVKKPNDKFQVLYLAHTQPLKGLHYLLDAWEKIQHKDAELIIVGGFASMPKEMEENYINRIKSDSRIKWTPGTNEPEKFMKEADIFVSPSLTEGYGRNVVEAMSCGLPIVTTYNAGCFVEDGKSGFVVPAQNADALAEKIDYLYTNRGVVEEMGGAARQAVEEKKPFGEAVLEVYEEIIRRKQK